MRAFWLNGGLHIEPESGVEFEALLILTRTFRLDLPPENDAPKTASESSAEGMGSCERGLDIDLNGG